MKKKSCELVKERPKGGDCALLVHVDFSMSHAPEDEDIDEFIELARSAGVQVADIVRAKRKAPDSKFFVGLGKTEEIAHRIREYDANLVLFNHQLSPAQQRNLEVKLCCRVLERTGLILDIFAQRARTYEGKLQVELAQLKHLSTRLVRGWSHLERQKGGIGLRGPGETQLETDRRLLGLRVKNIKGKLEKVRLRRAQGCRARRRAHIPVISLLGYTNAGKSTLFNQLTGAKVYVADQLFASLDPTLRKTHITGIGPAILTDTVGFIRHLPHDLIEAFQATLEEAREADIILHVVDSTNNRKDDCIEQVEKVLEQINAKTVISLLVFNKIDHLLDNTGIARVNRDKQGKPIAVWLSAQTGQGIGLLMQTLTEIFADSMLHKCLHLPQHSGSLRASLYKLGCVLKEEVTALGSYCLLVHLRKIDDQQMMKARSDQSAEIITQSVKKGACAESVFEEFVARMNFAL